MVFTPFLGQSSSNDTILHYVLYNYFYDSLFNEMQQLKFSSLIFRFSSDTFIFTIIKFSMKLFSSAFLFTNFNFYFRIYTKKISNTFYKNSIQIVSLVNNTKKKKKTSEFLFYILLTKFLLSINALLFLMNIIYIYHLFLL